MTGYIRGDDRRALGHSTPVEWAVRILTGLSILALALVLIVTFFGVIRLEAPAWSSLP